MGWGLNGGKDAGEKGKTEAEQDLGPPRMHGPHPNILRLGTTAPLGGEGML